MIFLDNLSQLRAKLRCESVISLALVFAKVLFHLFAKFGLGWPSIRLFSPLRLESATVITLVVSSIACRSLCQMIGVLLRFDVHRSPEIILINLPLGTLIHKVRGGYQSDWLGSHTKAGEITIICWKAGVFMTSSC